MKWLTDLWHLPMVWDLIIPLGLVMIFIIILVWDSRLPPEKRRILKFRKNAAK
jgi:hypothetical protein